MKQYNPGSVASQLLPLITVVLLSLVVSSCASSGGSLPVSDNRAASSRILACKATDTLVDSSNQCLQDDAACYQMSNGKWCTGERGNVCPAGSSELPAGVACPSGNRCLSVGESLECTIN